MPFPLPRRHFPDQLSAELAAQRHGREARRDPEAARRLHAYRLELAAQRRAKEAGEPRIRDIAFDGIAWLILLGVWLILFAILNPAEAREVALPVSDYALRHATVLFLLAVAAAIVAVALNRRARG